MIASLAPDVYAQNNHDVSSSFTIWASSELTQNEPQQIQGKLCTEFIPTTNEDYEYSRPGHTIVTVIYYTTTPNDKLFNVTNPVEAEEVDNNCILVVQYNPTNEIGRYSVYSEILWYSNGIPHNATSNTFTYEVKQGIFQNAKITKISNSTAFLRDWSSDGRFIVGDNLMLFSSDWKSLPTPELPNYLRNVGLAQISLNNDQILFTAVHDVADKAYLEVYKYGLDDNSLVQIASNSGMYSSDIVDEIIGADWLPDGRILLVQNTINWKDTSHQTGSLWIADSEGKKIERVLTVEGGMTSLIDVNNENKVVFFHQSKLMTFDLTSKRLFEIPHDFGSGCITMVKWAADSDLILYESQACRRVPGGSIEVISDDGKFHEVIYSSSNAPYTAVLSPDGSKLVFSQADGLYEMQFTQPMPEFSSFTTILLFLCLLAFVIVVPKIKASVHNGLNYSNIGIVKLD